MFFRKIYSGSSFIAKKTKTMNLSKCYFRYDDKEIKVDIKLLMKVKDSMRQFNFSRNPSENVENLCTRIATNVQKATKVKGKHVTPIEVKIFDFKDDLVSNDTTCLELFEMQGPIKVCISDHVYEAVFNVPWVVNINLPQCILAGFPVNPENIITHNADNDKTIFRWYRGLPFDEKGNNNKLSDMHIKWDFIATSFAYTPSSEDVGMKLKLECTPGNEKVTGPVAEIVSKTVVQAGPGQCPFETRHLFTKSKLMGKSFRCVSYNILADLYCDSDFTRTVLHPYCPPYALQIDYRKQLILKELIGYKADIMCLQEVDKKIFEGYLQPYLEMEGFQGVFHKKGKEVAEGLTCFFRKERFRLIRQQTILLSQSLKTEDCFKTIWDSVKDNKAFTDRLLDRSTIASAILLQSIENPEEMVLVGNTHLYFHPDADHIRLIQGGIVIYWLNDLKANIVKEFPDKRASLVICGDFNSVPSCGIYQLYTTGVAPSSLPDWSSNEAEAVRDLKLQQYTSLASACGTPKYTNFTAEFADCLDYIYYETRSLDVEQVIPMPCEKELRAHTALPSVVFPSDHIALVSDLRFKSC